MEVADKISVLIVDDRPEKLLALEAVLADLPLEIVRAPLRSRCPPLPPRR